MSIKVTQMLRPFNKGFSALQIKLVMNDLVFRYTKTVQAKIKIRIFKDNNDYFIYAKIPSESNDEYPDSGPLHYDVIIQLSPPNKASLAWDNIREYDAKVYANIPSFTFTFNYIYHFRRALIDLPSGFYTRRAVMERARVRNPLNLLGIEKSLWFTVFHLDDCKLFRRNRIDSFAEEDLSLTKLIKEEKIKSQDYKLHECERREKHKRDLKEAERKKKGRALARIKSSKNPVRSGEAAELFSDLSSGLRKDRFQDKMLAASLNNSSPLKDPAPLKSSLKSNLKSNLRSSL
jgi:hypothetical protein